MPIHAGPQRPAKADRKAYNLDPGSTRNDKVTEFMDGHQNTQGDNQSENVLQELHTPIRTGSYSLDRDYRRELPAHPEVSCRLNEFEPVFIVSI